MEVVYCHAMGVNSLGKYGIPGRVNIWSNITRYQSFGFTSDLPLHRQSPATRVGVLRIVLGTVSTFAIVVLLVLGENYI